MDTDSAMTAEDVRAWQDALGLSLDDAARLLGKSRTTMQDYRTRGAPAPIGLACAALAAQLPSWRVGMPAKRLGERRGRGRPVKSAEK